MALFGNKKTEKEAAKPTAKTAVKKAAVKAVKDKGAKKEEKMSMQDLYSGATPAVSGSKQAAVVSKVNDSYRVLVKPLITEKATNLVGENKYVFVVSQNANKIEIAKAIKATYGVSPVQVNVVNVSGKKVSRGRISGQRNDWRKAIITLAKGEAIKIYEGV
jgi:large subunit ribosomal protein L23